ncbi:DUF1835 domain-containing protein [Kordiimonas sp. SCSIO 12603]|uniref:DUF1835 domain-containing protein n=1 Tax=Kordiimonas sp. SCSIO 12603 TaxID=2829596 RepID=UPI002104933F|nr:DUF1835 domain-containing protein [Kordiimonas sp. SCSIO 12603]UTW57943.1 DUF1835 domain-containing protein [Kordiimonas sp. SCSIO 12603]
MLDSEKTLHIRCGSDIKQGLEKAGFVGSFLEFSDPLCQGPVLDTVEDEFLYARADFIKEAFGGDTDRALKQLKSQYDALNDLDKYEEIILWFEHDTYDQLILAKLLSAFTGRELPPVHLILISDYDVEPRFIGLGQLSPENLKSVWEQRKQVRTQQFEYGNRVWQAVIQPKPDAVEALIAEDESVIPEMRNALKRHLQQLPDKMRLLSLTEELSLKILQKEASSVGTVFRKLMLEEEPLPYLGDMMFWYEFQSLIAGGLLEETEPAKDWPAKRFKLSEKGEKLLEEGAEAAGWTIPLERWVGGIKITAESTLYYRRDA